MATVLSGTLNGMIEGDDVALDGGTASFVDKNVGEDKTVTLTGATLTGDDAGNYELTSVADTTADITQKSITGSFTTENKEYNGNTTAVVLTRALDGVISPDVVSLTGGTATFADKNVGTGKTVTLAGATLAGADAGNYALGSVEEETADITAKPITGSFTADNKVYDGTTAATVLTRTLNDAIVDDDVALDGGTATFADKNVANGKTVTLTGAALVGVDAGNYNLTGVGTTNANITPKPLFITAESVSKELGGADPAFTVSYDSFVDGENNSVLTGTLVFTFIGVSPTSYGPSTTPPQKRGGYLIRPSGLSAGSNYAVTFVDGVYAISGAYFLFLDEDVIRKGPPPSGFTAPSFTDYDINEGKVRIGLRSARVVRQQRQHQQDHRPAERPGRR